MDNPQFTDDEFVNGASFQSAFTSIQGNFEEVGYALHSAGLVNPTGITLSPSGLIVTVSQTGGQLVEVLFGSGILAGMHGTANGQDSSTYAVNFSSLVPGSGSVTAYCLASYQAISQNPIIIPGPPQGHPDFDPNFAPFQFYTTTRDSIALSATLSAPDNISTFEIFRVTLSQGQVTITSGSLITTFRRYASSILAPTGVTAGTYTPATITVAADGRITAASTWSIPNSGVTAGTYAPAKVTVGADGRVTSASNVPVGSGLSFSGGTLAIANTSVTPGTYTPCTLTVEADGRITSASSWSIPNSGVTPGAYSPANVTVGADGRVTAASNVGIGSGLSFSSNTLSVAGSGVTPGSYSPANVTVGNDGRVTGASSVGIGAGLLFSSNTLSVNQPHGLEAFGGPASGNFTVPSDVYSLYVQAWGGGGGGGGSGATGSAAGGGAGGYTAGIIAVTPGQVIAYVAGTGGSGGAAGNGASGTATTFSTFTAHGGGGGGFASSGVSRGVTGGVASGGALAVNGGGSYDGTIDAFGITGAFFGGAGGASSFGCAIQGAILNVGGNGIFPGNGGAGGCQSGNGGAGGEGLLIIQW